ncbi:F-box/LRR-repeat protein, partial [Trifolium medium]|nr:F-box/LRR-repeat protein [Trifolium medium]
MTKTTPSQSATVESINDFSDEILTHILSFLPLKEAFRTTVLSKRWRPLFHSLSVLRFDDTGVKNTDNWILFRRFMDSVMFSPHSHNLTLKSFHLNCRSMRWDSKSDCFNLNDWLQEAKRRRVEELHLFFLLGIPLVPNIFICKTLVVLKLKSILVTTMFDCSVDLPLLKNLDLFFVRFECMEDFMKLLSGCPVLENLKTSYVKTTAQFNMKGYGDPVSELIKAEIHLFDAGLGNDREVLRTEIKKLISGCSMLADLKTEYVNANVGVTVGGYSKPLSKLIKADIHLFDVPLRAVSG